MGCFPKNKPTSLTYTVTQEALKQILVRQRTNKQGRISHLEHLAVRVLRWYLCVLRCHGGKNRRSVLGEQLGYFCTTRLTQPWGSLTGISVSRTKPNRFGMPLEQNAHNKLKNRSLALFFCHPVCCGSGR